MAVTEGLKNTLYGILAAICLSVMGAGWVGFNKAQAGLNQLSINTQAIKDIGTAMELRGIDRVIESKSKEIRDKEVDILNNSDNPPLKNLLQSQVKTLHDEIEMQKVIRECVVDPTKKVCK